MAISPYIFTLKLPSIIQRTITPELSAHFTIMGKNNDIYCTKHYTQLINN